MKQKISKILKKMCSKYLEEEDFIDLSVEKLDPKLETYTKKQEEEIFEQLAKIEGISEFLHSTLSADIRRAFKTEEYIQQDRIKGAYARTFYFLSGIQKMLKKEPPKETKTEKLKIKRYA